MLCLICAVFFRVIFFHTKFTFTFIGLLNAIFAAPAPSSVIILSLPLLVNNAVSVQYILLGFILCAETAKNVDICQCWCYNTVSTILLCFEAEEQYHKECAEQKRKEKGSESLSESFSFCLTISDSCIIIELVGRSPQKGGVSMQRYIMTFVVAVMARLVGDCVSKWLGRHFKSDK